MSVHEFVDAVVLRQAGVDRDSAEENESDNRRDERRGASLERVFWPESSQGAAPLAGRTAYNRRRPSKVTARRKGACARVR